MSKQLMLSASVSVLAMLGFVLAGTPAAAADTGYGLPLLNAVASACTITGLGELLPAVQPGLR